MRYFDRLLSPNTYTHKALKMVGCATLLLAVGCQRDTPKDARSDIEAPVERIMFDFMGEGYDSNDFDFNDESTKLKSDDCLDDTPYDPIASGRQPQDGAALVTTDTIGETLVATITPSANHPEADPLRLMGFEDANHSLRGSDQASQEILVTYGCEKSSDSGR